MRHILKLHRLLSDLIPILSKSFQIQTFDPLKDKNEWLELNNKIFIDHPDQGNWAIADLENRIAEPWFDSNGFFLITEKQKIVGFCWTKIHHDFVNQDPIGEIYVLGVDPDTHKQGIGKAAAITGLNYLKAQGLKEVMLYVDADNSKALRLYEQLGFN